jgi:hypothetical protein
MKTMMKTFAALLFAGTMTLAVAAGCNPGEPSLDQATAEVRGPKPDRDSPDVEMCSGVDEQGNVFLYEGPCDDDCDKEW